MFASDLRPSRGQLETIARLACELHNVQLETRLDATTAIVRFNEALSTHSSEVQPVAAF